MAGIYGADVAQLRALGKSLTASSARLASTRTALSRDVRDPGRWKGADAEAFRNDWAGTHSLLLGKVIEALAEAGKAARRHADEQELASGAGGTAGRTSAAGGPSGKGGWDSAAEYLTGGEHSVARHPDRGEADLAAPELDRLRGLVRDAASGSNFFVGNDTDVNELRDALAGLKPAQLTQLLESLTDDEIRSLGSGAATDGKGLFNGEGTTPFERQQLLDQLLSKASAEQVGRLKDLIPWAQPDGTAMGDAARSGGPDPSRPDQWAEPKWPVIGQRPSTDDIKQGQYGDCVVLAAAGAMINADPGWASEHVTDNGNGTVSVLLFDKNGQEQWVTVTSDLPANNKGTQMGAKAGFGGNWPAYVEKALAQVYTEDDNNDGTKEGTPPDRAYPPGHYRAIEGNWGPDAFQYLAGPDIARTTAPDDVWEAARQGRAALVTTLADLPQGAPDGYHTSHAYFVTGLDAEGNILLQNPWGSQYPVLTVTPQDFKDKYQDASVAR
ncbi:MULTISPECIES: C2 family cysteine protease [unclassified Arthrobacter]|uniref:C2 family cysteine protease n=1 Tax=unclassified Arthrobacter TaxID=235627 RepID=UPI001C85142E|nr:C2 family cysteine protease [Arthrobacter sp. MAHUQ-56]MBX7445074.1 hypothetical protein [Arthrobacter sp. MAHUQ-56]